MKVVVLHGLLFTSRLTTYQHTLSFARHLAGCDVTYVNGLGLVDGHNLERDFDLAIVTYELLAFRNTPFWKYIEHRIAPILRRSSVRVVMPQDDYSSSSVLDDFVAANDIDYVFSPLTRDLRMLYPRSIAKGVSFHEAFTGYWEASTALPFLEYRKSFSERSIDLGQRVRHLPPQFGPLAQKKGQLAIDFAAKAEQEGFTCDVSTRDADVLIGSDWWKFLGNIRFTVGRLGGASIADPRGKLAAKAHQLALRNPSVTYEEIARKLRTSDLPQGDFTAISPRLFECAAMGVCQVLEEAHYFDGFEPWRHYLPLAQDMSNAAEVFAAMRDHDRCSEIANNAAEELTRSDTHTYRTFVHRLILESTGFDTIDKAPPVQHDADAELFTPGDATDPESAKAHARRRVILGRWSGSATGAEGAEHWADLFRSRRLIVESLLLPWSPALVHLANS